MAVPGPPANTGAAGRETALQADDPRSAVGGASASDIRRHLLLCLWESSEAAQRRRPVLRLLLCRTAGMEHLQQHPEQSEWESCRQRQPGVQGLLPAPGVATLDGLFEPA